MINDADRLKAVINPIEYIRQYVPLKRKGKHEEACCPFHSESHPSFKVDERGWRCYGSCVDGGDVISFAMRYHSLSFTDALKHLADYAHIELTPLSHEQQQRSARDERLLGLLDSAATLYSDLLRQTPFARDYLLHERRLIQETIETYRLGYSDQWSVPKALHEMGYSKDDMVDAGILGKNDDGSYFDRFRSRVMFPIMDEKGRVRGFGARSLDGTGPKFVNTPASDLFDKSSLLYGLSSSVCRMPLSDTRRGVHSTQTVIVLEGYMDVLQTRQNAIFNTVAQMGTAFTEKQITLLHAQGVKTVVLCLDNDEAGRSAMRKAAEIHLKSGLVDRFGIDLKVMVLSGGKDPDEVLRNVPSLWHAAVDQARPIADVLIEYEVGQLPSDVTLQRKQEAAKRVLSLITSDNVWSRHENVRKLATAFFVDENTMINWVTQQSLTVIKTPHKAKMPDTGPTYEHWVLSYILLFEEKDYIGSANQVLCNVSMEFPYDDMLVCFYAGLMPSDFTDPVLKRLMAMINCAREKNAPLVESLSNDIDEPRLRDAFDRVMRVEEWARALGQYPEISYRVFLDLTLTVRIARLEVECEAYKTDIPKWARYTEAIAALYDARAAL